jgi:hypothetical protein
MPRSSVNRQSSLKEQSEKYLIYARISRSQKRNHPFALIESEQVKRADDLIMEDGRKLLILRGGNSQLLTNRILTEFSQRLDRAGNKFRISRAWRGLSQTDPYGAPSRISGPEMEAFLSEWFCFVELVQSAPPQSLNSPPLKNSGQQQYLKILDRLPPFVIALISQSRFVTNQLVSLFEVID